jgi:NAD+ kinase
MIDALTFCTDVLLLLKPGDEELLTTAAAAIHEWTTPTAMTRASGSNSSSPDVSNKEEIRVMVDPTTAALLEHKYGVRSEFLHLFEPKPTPGFGSHLTPSDRQRSSGLQDPWDPISQESLPSVFGDVVPDLICTLGGDGLLMHAGMIFQGPIPPILCIAGGSLGFLTPFQTDEMVEAVRIALGLLDDVSSEGPLNGNRMGSSGDLDVFPPNMPSYPYDPLPTTPTTFGSGARMCLSIRMRLCCQVMNREGVVRAQFNVLNEVVIDRGSSPYLAALECFCDDVHLTTVQADGIIFATPTGSTAYSMAAGGSVVHPAVPCILVTPICPHVLSFRSMVFPDHVVLCCYVPEDARSVASIAFDGKHRQELRRGESVQIRLSAYPVPTLNRQDHSADWLGSLKRNFNFNTRARQKPLSSENTSTS